MSLPNSDEEIRGILQNAKVALCIGASANPARPSHFVSELLIERGLRVIPINPGLAGQQLWGETVYSSIAALPKAEQQAVDFVDIFRRPEEVPAVVDEALAHLPNLTCIWMQIGVAHADAAAKARAAGVKVVENRCPKVEFPRLLPL